MTETIVGLWWEISFTVITSHLDADCMYHKQCHSQFPQVRRRHAAHEKTGLRRAAETTMHDCWTIGGALDLSDERTGSTRFQVLRPRLLPQWLVGRLAQIEGTTRLDTAWPEVWITVSEMLAGAGGCIMGKRRTTHCKRLVVKEASSNF